MSSNPPHPLFLQKLQVLQISEDYLRINDIAHPSCFDNKSGKSDSSNVAFIRTHHFSYSHTQNNFIVIGCDIFAYITEQNSTTYASGCASICPNSSITAGFSSFTCSVVGCCRTNFHKDIKWFYLRIRSINMITPAWTSMPCGLAFIAERNFSIYKNFNVSNKIDKNLYFVPAVLEWSVGKVSCSEAVRRKNYACGQNTHCINSTKGQGYKCRCFKGYQGNPYLANGCKDINECNDPNKKFCHKKALCTNIHGSYLCACPAGYHGDGKKDGTGCIPGKHTHVLAMVFSLGVGITIVPLILLATGLRLYHGRQETEKNKIKHKFFKKNGGLLLQQQISSSKDSVQKTKLYLIEELEKATDGFNSSRIIGKGGLGTVYKGMLSDGTIVAIKKSNTVDGKQLDQFVNEVFILSQINHSKIVRLLSGD